MPLQPLSPTSTLLLNLKEPEGCVDTMTGKAKTGLECGTTTNPTWIHRWTGYGADTSNSTLRADIVTEIRQLLPFAAATKRALPLLYPTIEGTPPSLSSSKRRTALARSRALLWPCGNYSLLVPSFACSPACFIHIDPNTVEVLTSTSTLISTAGFAADVRQILMDTVEQMRKETCGRCAIDDFL
ncbi:hypothetical protein BC829DRAFT_441083 [Chytridium lagenaria]|nr:hypothetical protein BC829DRAFT_441083 [Chytridium lagenaria]